MRTGLPGADLPARFGKYSSVCRRFRGLAQKSGWEALFDALKAPKPDWVMRDSTTLRAHQHAASQKEATPKPNAWTAAGAK